MTSSALRKEIPEIKNPEKLSGRISWLRDYYFKGTGRAWNNEFTAWTTGTQEPGGLPAPGPAQPDEARPPVERRQECRRHGDPQPGCH